MGGCFRVLGRILGGGGIEMGSRRMRETVSRAEKVEV